MLLYFGVTPYLVFDGDHLPSKAVTEAERAKRREESKKLALELQSKGRTGEAYQEFQKAVDVTPYMARQLIEELKKMKVQYVVAPYEADAQLVYLERQGIINGIISEDSDLLVFGAKRLLSKLDQHGDCIEINRSDFAACRDISLIGWTDADFRRMCILSGCDYLPNIPKMGIKTAYRSMRKYKNVERVLKALQLEGHLQVPKDYLDSFKQAERTFLYQWVFCPKARKLVNLTPLDGDVRLEDMPYIGVEVEQEVAVGVACGDLDPFTKEPINLKPSTASRTILGPVRRHMPAPSADLKPAKPIDSFFTPKRVPLAELDPNSLTPSPTQQQLLERHANNSWEPRLVNQDLTPSSSTGSARSTPSSVTRSADRRASLTRASTAPTFPATKRQRLCAETDDEELPASSEGCQSRYFANAESKLSGSGQELPRVKKSRRSTFGVYCDEIEEDKKSRPSRTPLTEANSEIGDSSRDAAAATVPEPQGTKAARQAGEDVVSGSPRTRPSDETKTQPTLDADPSKGASLLSRFAFQATPSQASSGAPKARREDIELALSTPSARPSNHVVRQRLTPLQRLGQSALTRCRSVDSIAARNMLTAASRDSGYESDFGRDSEETPIKQCAQGSEDQIIPCSEDEGEEETDSRPRATLDLKRFSFIPK